MIFVKAIIHCGNRTLPQTFSSEHRSTLNSTPQVHFSPYHLYPLYTLPPRLSKYGCSEGDINCFYSILFHREMGRRYLTATMTASLTPSVNTNKSTTWTSSAFHNDTKPTHTRGDIRITAMGIYFVGCVVMCSRRMKL